MSEKVIFDWSIEVRYWNDRGDRIAKSVPATIRASTREEVTNKMQQAFGAEFDSFRRFWSHDWILKSVKEVPS